MAGDRALSLLIDIKARNSFSGVIGLLGASFSGLFNSLGNLAFGFRNLGTAGTIGMDALKLGAVGLVKSLLQIAAVLGLVAVAVGIALGVAAVKAAGDFEQGLHRLVTGAGDLTDNMTKMGQAILGISMATGVLTGPLLSAMYQIISAGQRGAQAQDTLAVAARGAVVEQAKIVDVAKALTTAMTDYGTKQFNATQFMNGYTRAVQLGKITLEELSQTMGPILPLAKNLGISFADVAAAMSTMTNAGIPAARAATSLRFLFQSMENPTHKAALAMKMWGLDSVALANEMKKSLPGALQMVYDAAKKAGPEGSVPFNRAVSDMIGGQRSLSAFLALSGTHMKTFADNAKQIASAMGISKTAVLGWDVAQKNLNQAFDRFKAVGQGLLIVLGTALAPLLQRFLGWITPIIAGFVQWELKTHGIENALAAVGGAIQSVVNFGAGIISFFQHSQLAMALLQGVLIVGALVISGLLVAAFIAWAIAAGTAAIATLAAIWPFVLIGAIVVLVVAGIILAIRHWGDITTWFQNLWNTVWTAVSGFFVSIWHTIEKAALGGLAIILSALQYIPGPLGDMARHALKIVNDMAAGIDASTNTMKVHVASHMDQMQQQATQKAREMKNQLVGGSIIPDTVNSIIAWFGKLPGGVMSAISSLGGRLASFFGGLANQALSWGRNIIANLAAGITAGIGAAVQAAMNVASAVARVLHHSTPDVGPLAGDDLWGLHFIDNLVMGMRMGIPALAAAAASVASTMGGGYTLGSTLYASGGGWSNNRANAWPTGGSSSVVVVHVYPPDVTLDGETVVDKVMTRAATHVRRHGGPVRNR